MSQLTNLGWLGLAQEVTPGLYVAPTLCIPYTGVSPEDLAERIPDDSADANATKLRGVYDGVKDATFGWDGILYPEVIGPLLIALGLVDTISGAGPYVHTFKFPAVAVAQKSYSVSHFNTYETRGYPGMKLDELGFTIEQKGTVKYSTKWKGFPSGAQSTPSPSYATPSAFLPWMNAVTIGGVASTRQLMTDITVRRNVEEQHTQSGTQSPREILSGEIESALKGKALFEDNTDWTHFNNNDQPSFQSVITMPGGGSNPILTLKVGKAAFRSPTRVDMSGRAAALDYEADGVYLAADAGPFMAILSNGVTPAYT